MDRSTYFSRHKHLAGVYVFFDDEPMKTIIKVRRGSRILLVEDNKERLAWFFSKMSHEAIWDEKDPDATVELLRTITPESFDKIFLDFDLGPGNMKNSTINSIPVVDFLNSRLTTRLSQRNIVIHSQNNPGSFWMHTMLPGAARVMFGNFDIQEVEDVRS